jgi:hypothetical protein
MRAYTRFARACGLVTLPFVPAIEISVRALSEADGTFHLIVRVRPGGGGARRGGGPGQGSDTTHEVSLARTFLERLSPREAPESFVRRCFLFLLEREPNDAILRKFDTATIGQYFPEFERTIAKH